MTPDTSQMHKARPSVNRDLFDSTVLKPFVRRAYTRVRGERRRMLTWGVYQKRNGVETCLASFPSRIEAANYAAKLWGH